MNHSLSVRRLVLIIGPISLLVALAAGLAWVYYASLATRPDRQRGPTVAEPRTNDARWLRRHNEHVSRAMVGHIKLLFLGDSITRGWLGTGRDAYDGDGLALWRERYAPRRAANFGVGSDRVEHLLWRIRHGELSGIDPMVVVLQIGTNNIGLDPPEEIAEGIAAVVFEIRRRLPETQILLIGLFPRGASPQNDPPFHHDRSDPRIDEINKRIAPLGCLDGVTYLEFGHRFLDTDGMIPRSIMPDYLHLSRRGYEIWAEAMEPFLRSWLGEPDR